MQVHAGLRKQWSPEQVAGRLRGADLLRISHETIYRHIWADKRAGGSLHTHLRGARKKYRKRYGYYDWRGRLGGKRSIRERPAVVEARSRIGDWEADTLLGSTGDSHCLLSLVERKTGYLVLGKLRARTTAEVNRRATRLLQAQPHPVHTITSDNGTEFHGYAALETATQATFYFATPHHAWERGTNENTNGLVRQYACRNGRASPTSRRTTAPGSRRRSTSGLGNGWAIARRRNAMRADAQCCTSKLI